MQACFFAQFPELKLVILILYMIYNTILHLQKIQKDNVAFYKISQYCTIKIKIIDLNNCIYCDVCTVLFLNLIVINNYTTYLNIHYYF